MKIESFFKGVGVHPYALDQMDDIEFWIQWQSIETGKNLCAQLKGTVTEFWELHTGWENVPIADPKKAAPTPGAAECLSVVRVKAHTREGHVLWIRLRWVSELTGKIMCAMPAAVVSRMPSDSEFPGSSWMDGTWLRWRTEDGIRSLIPLFSERTGPSRFDTDAE